MNDWILFITGIFLAAVVPEIALGASVGSLFFMLASSTEKGVRKALLLFIGWFVGYFTALPFMESGWAGFIAIIGSAFAVVLMLEVFTAFESGSGELPSILKSLIDAYNRIKRG